MERRPNILRLIMILLFILIALSSVFPIPPELYFVVVVVIIAGVAMTSRRSRTPRPRDTSPEFQEFPFPTRRPGIGRWIIIPIAIAGVVVFIFFQNWWLDVKIFVSMYLSKTGIDWWRINFLDNYYFYVCIAIGLLIALSDPRIAVEKDIQGKRRFYLHSKFWAMINAIVGQMAEYEGSPFPMVKREPYGDRISLKRGILWKSLEFLVGALIIGPLVARDLALVYLMISKWIESQQITWIIFLQKCFSVFYTRIFTPETISGFELGNWLIANSAVFEFLLWLRTPVFIFAGIWSARLIISAVLEVREGRIIKFFRNIVGIGVLLLIPYILQIPAQAFDVTTPFYVKATMIAMAVLIVLLVFLSLKSGWVQVSINRIFRNRIILFLIIIIISASLLYGPVVVAIQYTPAMQGRFKEYLWEPKYLPNVIYTRWSTGLEPIKEDDVDSAMDTGTNLEILRRIRVFNDVAAQFRLKPGIGVNWMDFPQKATKVDIIYANGKEYWVAPLTIVMPPGADLWRAPRILITHSERILAIDAATGEIVPIESVFNLKKPCAIYYGEAGLFASSPMVYIGIPGFPETRLSDSIPATYGGAYDYVLDGFERLWFFSGLYGRERMAWDFGRGDFGPVNMLFMRDIEMRLKQILLPGMILDADPYLVSDGSNIYYSMYIYIDRKMPTEYLDYPKYEDKYWRTFATVLVNAYDGSIQGYLLGKDESNYILDFYRAMYPQWNQPIPKWLTPQLRYPEFLFERQIDSYNTYHVSNPDYWQQSTDFFELTTNAAGRAIEDVRYVSFYLNHTTYWAAVRLVEYYRAPGRNLAGIYVALSGENIGDVFLLRTGSAAVIGPQTALDTIINYGLTKTELTLHPNWESGNILMYVINNRPYYFIPYYARTETTLAPQMIVVVDAISQKVGYYLINDPGDAKEVGLASEKAYLNLVGVTIELTAEARKTKVLDEFKSYTVKTPQQLNPDVAFQEKSISYYSDSDWAVTNSTISSFISSWVAPYNVDTILIWETMVSNVKYLNLGVLVSRAGIAELHYVTVAYG